MFQAIAAFTILVTVVGPATAADNSKADLPPGWLPLSRLDEKPTWKDFRKVKDKVHLYLPTGDKPVRGIFVCSVFHSADPRELADLWNFALVTVPPPFEYDLGHHDKRNQRAKLGHPIGNTGHLLTYLDAAAKETMRPELNTVPFVGWLGQNGAKICADLDKRAPGRVLAWGDGWFKHWPNYPELISRVPVASAWETYDGGDQARKKEFDAKSSKAAGQPTPADSLRCYALTYGFKHGIYSKFNFFVAYIDRCIRLRMPDEMPAPGQPVKLKPAVVADGWSGDWNPSTEWAPIAPVKDAKGFIAPVWMPDEYMAWAWRSYHSANPDLKLTSPVIEYRTGDRTGVGLGYGEIAPADKSFTFTADPKGKGEWAYAKVEFRDGNAIVGTADQAPWSVEKVKLAPGLHVLFAVGVKADGTRVASRPGLLMVK